MRCALLSQIDIGSARPNWKNRTATQGDPEVNGGGRAPPHTRLEPRAWVGAPERIVSMRVGGLEATSAVRRPDTLRSAQLPPIRTDAPDGTGGCVDRVCDRALPDDVRVWRKVRQDGGHVYPLSERQPGAHQANDFTAPAPSWGRCRATACPKSRGRRSAEPRGVRAPCSRRPLFAGGGRTTAGCGGGYGLLGHAAPCAWAPDRQEVGCWLPLTVSHRHDTAPTGLVLSATVSRGTGAPAVAPAT